MAQYSEGQQLRGSDGKIYVVRGGVPVTEGSPQPLGGVDPNKKYAEEDQGFQRQQAALAQQAAARANANSEVSNKNATDANRNATIKLNVDLAEKGLMVGPNGEIVARPEGVMTKKAPVDPQRRSQIESLQDVIGRTRAQADDFLAVGEYGKRAREWPLIGGFLGQNRADVEGLTKSIEGDIIQQQIARLSAQNGGNGVASLANSETEAARMAAAIANLSPDQSLEEFNAGLDRAEAYYNSQLEALGPKEGVTPFEQAAQGQRENANNAGGGQTQTGGNGFDRYVTDQDNAFHGQVTNLFKQGATTPQIRQFIEQSGYGQQYNDADIANAVAYRDGSGRYAKQGPQRGAGFQKPETGTRSLAQQTLGSFADTGPGAAVISGANALTLGGLDEIVGATQGDRAGQMAQYAKEYSRNESPWWALGGDVAGSLVPMGAMGVGARTIGGFASPAAKFIGGNAPRAALTANAAYGTGFGAGEMNDNRLLGGTIGGVASLAGGKGGEYIGGKIAPAVARGIPQVGKPQAQMMRAIGDDGQAILSQLRQAADMGLPMTLADTSPTLRALGGAAVRRSPVAKGIAEDVLLPRGRGQYDRLIGAIGRDLGPTANVPQYSDDLIEQARLASKPLYEQAFAAPGASSVDVSGIIKTPMGQRGLQNAGQRVQNRLGPDGQPVDPQSLGFDFNEAGDVALGQTPSFQTLDYMKQGLDDIINGGYDPMTRQYTPDAQAAIQLKNNLVGQMDSVNPVYKDARAAYAGPAGEREALQQGKSALSLSPDDMNYQRQGLSPTKQQQYGLGYRSGMTEQAGKSRLSGNPWETAYGTPQAQQKIGDLFPGGAGRFGQQYNAERNMAQTTNQVLGNSMTAERGLADQAFDGSMLGNLAFDAATTGAPLKTGASLLGKFAKDEIGRFGAKQKAEALAPLLFNPSAPDSARALDETIKTLTKQRRMIDVYQKSGKRKGSFFGAGSGTLGGMSGVSTSD